MKMIIKCNKECNGNNYQAKRFNINKKKFNNNVKMFFRTD